MPKQDDELLPQVVWFFKELLKEGDLESIKQLFAHWGSQQKKQILNTHMEVYVDSNHPKGYPSNIAEGLGHKQLATYLNDQYFLWTYPKTVATFARASIRTFFNQKVENFPLIKEQLKPVADFLTKKDARNLSLTCKSVFLQAERAAIEERRTEHEAVVSSRVTTPHC